ncbi:MAG: Asp23/Gls24 family envelope stress response protein [Clostridia bacterium]|nr:Asp23/Gls24 family envelope stress response protein [Clostridia bacterium]
MFNIKLNAKDNQSGKVVYNAGIVHNIVALAVAEVEGAILVQGKRSGISLYIEKDGIYVDVSVSVKYGYNVPELAYRIQQSVKQSVENMTKYKVAEVDVHIRDVVFDTAPAPEKEDEEEVADDNQPKTNEN